MKTSDWIITTVFVVFISIILTWGLTSIILFPEGAKVARLYHEATGEFPSKQWLGNNIYKGYDSPQEILETLKPY